MDSISKSIDTIPNSASKNNKDLQDVQANESAIEYGIIENNTLKGLGGDDLEEIPEQKRSTSINSENKRLKQYFNGKKQSKKDY